MVCKAKMNPYDAERLRDEVMYLHSLWHQGPPPPPQTPTPYITQRTCHVRPHPQPAPARTRSFPFSKRKKKRKRNLPQPHPGPEWPVPVGPDPNPAPSWPTPKPHPAPSPSPSPEEKERLFAMKAQQQACRAFETFLSNYTDHDDDGGDDDDDDGWEEFEEFFVGVFLEDHALRGYYQRSYESGEFCCLVCSAIGKKKSGKRFKDCVGLVHHSMSILKTLKKRAHRGFGLAICKVLGWDADRLPTVVIKGKPLGLEMKPAHAEGESQVNIVANDGDGKDGSQSHESDDKVVALEPGDQPVAEPAQEVDQSDVLPWKGVMMKKCWILKNGGGAIHEEKSGKVNFECDAASREVHLPHRNNGELDDSDFLGISIQSNSPSCTRNFDVFVSFRGEDACNGFSGHLLQLFREKGIVSVKDGQKSRNENA